jgi:hypothetical protein
MGNKRGMLNEEIDKLSEDFLHRKIEVSELRLYPFLDYCLKNDFEWRLGSLKANELPILNKLQEEKHIIYSASYFRCTREFYDFLQNVLAIAYVPNFFDPSLLLPDVKDDKVYG